MKNDLTQERLKELFNYNPDTGLFTWIKNPSKTSMKVIGKQPSSRNGHGYIHIGIDGNIYTAHRLVWLYVYGHWPKECIDHINGIRHDNRLINLRDASILNNSHNRRFNSENNKSGYMGVSLDSNKTPRYRAQIKHLGKVFHIGSFDSPYEAHQAYLKKKRELHEYCEI